MRGDDARDSQQQGLNIARCGASSIPAPALKLVEPRGIVDQDPLSELPLVKFCAASLAFAAASSLKWLREGVDAAEAQRRENRCDCTHHPRGPSRLRPRRLASSGKAAVHRQLDLVAGRQPSEVRLSERHDR